MRKLTIYSTVGNDMKEVFVQSTLWGDLQGELAGKGINVNGMKAIIGDSQVTLESNQAVLPEGEFILFLMPGKVKSGVIWSIGNEDEEEEGYPEDDTPKGQIKAKILSIGNDINELYVMVDNLTDSNDPAVQQLQQKAAEIKKNFGLFD